MEEFFDEQWPAMREAVESGGGAAVVVMIEAFDDTMMRHLLYSTARQGLVFRDWEGKHFDAYIAVCDAGLASLISEAESTSDERAYEDLMRGAHALGYNLTADLADCWPGDEMPRSRAHHERGLKAAEDCMRWAELRSPPSPEPLSRDHWARGIHQLALGESATSIESWERSLEFAQQHAGARQQSTAVDGGDFAVVLGHGYLGLGRWIAGEGDGETQYEASLAAFRAQVEDSDLKGGAEIGIGQLEKTRDRYGP